MKRLKLKKFKRLYLLQPKCPQTLSTLQQWMGELISSPFKETATYPFIESLCQNYILPSSSLRAHERLHIYHEQYWFRHFSTLQENFPTLLRLFGYQGFNFTLALPYLLKFPPKEWSLNELGSNFPTWIRESYTEKDLELVECIATIESAMNHSFLASSYPGIEKDDLVDLEDCILKLQPHVFLFKIPAHFFKLRDVLLEQSVDYWQTNPFPELEVNETYILLYRNILHRVSWKSLSLQEYHILKKFKEGASLTQVFEDKIDSVEELIRSFKEWTEQRLFFKRL